MTAGTTAPDPRQRIALAWSSPWVDVLIAAGAGSLAVVLCLHEIGRYALWHDEVFSVDAIRGGWRDLAAHAQTREVNMLTYYGVLKLWATLSTGDAWFRIPSAIFAGLAVAATYGLSHALFDRRVAVLASTLLACSAFLIQYGQEARVYTLAILLAVASTWALVGALRRPGPWRWGLYVILAALVPYTHVILMAIYPVQAIAILTATPRPSVRSLVVLGVAIGVLIAPAMILSVQQQADVLGWVPETSITGVLRAVRRFMGAGGPGPLEDLGMPANIRLLPALVAGLSLLGAVATLRRPDRRWAGLLVIAWVLVPLTATVVVSLIKPVFVARYLIYVMPAFAMLTALGVLALPRSWLRIPTAVLIVALVANGAAGWYGSQPRPDWRAATAWLVERFDPDDRAYYIGDFGRVVPYYARSLGKGDRVPPTLIHGLRPRTATLPEDLAAVAINVAAHGRTLWIVVTEQPLRPPEDDPRLAPLGKVMDLAEVARFDGLIVARYEPPR